MVYKLYNELGNYQDITTKEDRNLLSANWADTPEGMNVGWTEFETLEEAEIFFNVELKPIEQIANIEEQF